MGVSFGMRLLSAGSIWLGGLLFAGVCLAHPGVHEQEEAADAALAEQPLDAEAHLARGKLHFHAREWDQALAMFERARQLGAAGEQVAVLEGRTFLAVGWPRLAKLRFDRATEMAPHLPPAHIGRARALVALGRPAEAEANFASAFEALERTRPALVLERHDALVAAGRADAALRLLDERMNEMGLIPSLQLAAVDLDIAAARYDGALRRIDALLAQSPGHPHWAVRRAEVLSAAGRGAEARDAYESALASLQSRIARRPSERLEKLNREVRAALATQERSETQ